MTIIKLSQYAKDRGIGYRAAWNRFKAGKIPNARVTDTGTIEIELIKPKKPEYNVVYTRVSTSDQKKDLEKLTYDVSYLDVYLQKKNRVPNTRI